MSPLDFLAGLGAALGLCWLVASALTFIWLRD